MHGKSLTALLLILIALSGCVSSAHRANTMAFSKVNRVWHLVNRLYYRTPNHAAMADSIIRGMTKALDPHSVLLTSQENERFTRRLHSDISGIGIRPIQYQDTLFILETISGGSAAESGLKAGDKILQIDGQDILGCPIDSIHTRIRGKAGSLIELLVEPWLSDQKKTVGLIRKRMSNTAIRYAYLLADSIGCIGIGSFRLGMYSEIKKALDSMQQLGMKSLLMDLRGNGGGYIDGAIQMAELFLPPQSHIVTIRKGHAPSRSKHFKSDKAHPRYEHLPLVVLADESTASASEIFIGAIQDHDRGIIVGRRTFGKGLVQQQYKLSDDSQLLLTVGEYCTPAGRVIQKPFRPGSFDAYKIETYLRKNHGEPSYTDNLPDSLFVRTLHSKRRVYAGEGIMPDSYVAPDSTRNSVLIADMNRSGAISVQGLRYALRHRTELMEAYPTAAAFEAWRPPTEWVREIWETDGKASKHFSPEAVTADTPLLKQLLHAEVASALFGLSAYYRILDAHTPDYQEAIRLLTHPPLYQSLLRGRPE